jgi:aspartate kinase
MVVLKFGGSSLESTESLERVLTIIAECHSPERLVVVSAMGKTTDRLLQALALAETGNDVDAISVLNQLRDYHRLQVEPLISGSLDKEMELTLRSYFDQLRSLATQISARREVTPQLRDAWVSFGERLSSQLVTLILLSASLPAVHFDAQRMLVTDNRFGQAAPDHVLTGERLTAAWNRKPTNSVAVMGGFIGGTKENQPTTLGRGGSDFSAAIAGAALKAQEIQIWTDVDGMLTADPRVFPAPHRIKEISFEEAAELA